MPARSLKTLETEIARAKMHFGLPATAAVVSCYEAGRDGFWLHQYLVSRGIANRIVETRCHQPTTRCRVIALALNQHFLNGLDKSWLIGGGRSIEKSDHARLIPNLSRPGARSLVRDGLVLDEPTTVFFGDNQRGVRSSRNYATVGQPLPLTLVELMHDGDVRPDK